jgi:hypothetical protein
MVAIDRRICPRLRTHTAPRVSRIEDSLWRSLIEGGGGRKEALWRRCSDLPGGGGDNAVSWRGAGRWSGGGLSAGDPRRVGWGRRSGGARRAAATGRLLAGCGGERGGSRGGGWRARSGAAGGAGGAAAVCRARARIVRLGLRRLRRGAGDRLRGEDLRSRRTTASILDLKNEVRTAWSLSHPNVVVPYDAASVKHGRWFFAMELVRGRRIVDAFAADASERAAGVARCRCSGRSLTRSTSCTRSGVLHLDLTPNNILVREDGTPAILDLGPGAVGRYARPIGTLRGRSRGSTGTLSYIAPEVLLGRAADGGERLVLAGDRAL